MHVDFIARLNVHLRNGVFLYHCRCTDPSNDGCHRDRTASD